MSSPQPSQLPTSQEIEAVILAATNNLTITGQPLKDTRTQVFVGNLPYRVRWQDLKDLFRSPPPTPSSEFHPHLPHPQQESRVTNTVLRADVSLGPDNRSRGYGTVLLATKEDADRCINLLDGYCWMGRVLEVRVDRLVASPSAAMFPGGVSGVGTTPPPPPLQQQQQQMQGMGKTLYLTNIPPQTQWTSLKDLLRALQITVIRVDLSLSSSLPTSSSPSTSWAKVIVASSNDVRRAIGGLDGIEYMGYVLRVRTEEELVQLQTSLLQQEQNVSEAAMVPIPPSQSQSPIPSMGGSGRRSVPPPPLPLGSLAPGSGSPPREKEKDKDSSSNASSSNSAETTRSTSSRHHLPPHLRHHHTHHQPHPHQHPQHPGPISLPLSVLTHPHPHPHHPYSPLHHPSQTQLGLPPLTPSMPSFQFSGTTSGTPLQPHFLSPGIGIGGGNGTPGGGNGGGGWGRTPGGWGMMMLGGMGSPPIMQQQQSPMHQHHHQPQPGDYFQPPMIPSPYQQPPPQQQQQPEYFPPVPPIPPPPPNSLLTSPDPSLTSFNNDPSSSLSGSSPSSVSGLTTDDGSGGSPGISQNTSSIATSLSSSASSSFSSPGEGSQVEGGGKSTTTMTRTTSDPLTTTSTAGESTTAPGLPSPPSSPRHPPPPLKKKDHPRFKESEFANILSGGAFASLNLGGVGGVGGTTPLGQRRNSWTPGTERGPVF